MNPGTMAHFKDVMETNVLKDQRISTGHRAKRMADKYVRTGNKLVNHRM